MKRTVFIVALPVKIIARLGHVHFSIHPLVGKYTVALFVSFSGAAMAMNPINGVPHFIWDGVAYIIHGIGAAPIAEDVLNHMRRRQERRVKRKDNNNPA